MHCVAVAGDMLQVIACISYSAPPRYTFFAWVPAFAVLATEHREDIAHAWGALSRVFAAAMAAAAVEASSAPVTAALVSVPGLGT